MHTKNFGNFTRSPNAILLPQSEHQAVLVGWLVDCLYASNRLTTVYLLDCKCVEATLAPRQHQQYLER